MPWNWHAAFHCIGKYSTRTPTGFLYSDLTKLPKRQEGFDFLPEGTNMPTNTATSTIEQGELESEIAASHTHLWKALTGETTVWWPRIFTPMRKPRLPHWKRSSAAGCMKIGRRRRADLVPRLRDRHSALARPRRLHGPALWTGAQAAASGTGRPGRRHDSEIIRFHYRPIGYPLDSPNPNL
jgi:hypothetical protein